MKSSEKVADYFVEEFNPYTKRKTFSLKRIGAVLLGLLGVMLLGVLFYPSGEERLEAGSGSEGIEARTAQAGQAAQAQAAAGSLSFGSDSGSSGSSHGRGARGGQRPAVSRQYDVSQVVRREGGGDRLPTGTLIPARLLNRVSSAARSPVIGEIRQPVLWKGATVIPPGTRAIGEGSLDDRSGRLVAQFSTLVFPGGEEFPVSAVATMPDGSSGIEGDYQSGDLKKQGGQFLGNFLGGMAEGLKEKASSGQMGMIYEPGGLKNGLLNGAQISALEWAKAHADAAQGEQPYVEVPGGAGFLIYLERAFGP